jgi:DNA-binding XRE family transcriptional regulator
MYRTAEEIRRVRETLQMSQEQFAGRIGVTRRTVIRWEQEGVGDSVTVANRASIESAEAEAQAVTSPIIKLDRQVDILRQQIVGKLVNLDLRGLQQIHRIVSQYELRALVLRNVDEVREILREHDDHGGNGRLVADESD